MFADRMADANQIQMIPGIIILVGIAAFVLAAVVAVGFVLYLCLRSREGDTPNHL